MQRFGIKYSYDPVTYGINSGTQLIEHLMKDCETTENKLNVLIEIIGNIIESPNTHKMLNLVGCYGDVVPHPHDT